MPFGGAVRALVVASWLMSGAAMAADDEPGAVFVAAGLAGYTIAPVTTESGAPHVAFRMELHRDVTFMARAAQHHTVGLALDFVGIDIPKTWRSLMATYAYKDLLLRFQTGQIAGRVDGGEAYTGPFVDVIAVRYGKFLGGIGGRYTSMVRPLATWAYAGGGKRFGLDARARVETIGPVLYTDHMFEALRDDGLTQPGLVELGEDSALAVDMIVQVGLSVVRSSLGYELLHPGEPTSWVTLSANTEARGHVLFYAPEKHYSGSAGVFARMMLVGAPYDADHLSPALTPELHLGPYVRFGGLF